MKAKRYKNCKLTQVKVVERKGYPVASLQFMGVYDPETKEPTNLFYSMFLTESNNDRNREILQALGVTNPPDIINRDMFMVEIAGLGHKVVDLAQVPSKTREGEFNMFLDPAKYPVRVVVD